MLVENSQDDTTPVWGAEAIGREIGRSERQVYYLASRGLIDVDRVGKVLVTTRARLRRMFAGKVA